MKVVLSMVVFLVLFSGSALAQECSVDVFNLEVEDDQISAEILNAGDATTVFYQFFVDGEEISNASITMGSEDEKEVSNGYEFDPGEWDVRVDVQAECGATDSEEITYFLLEEASCSLPTGFDGDNYCDFSQQTLFVCDEDHWDIVAVGQGDYCTSCGMPVCGDGVCNCFEDQSICPQDCGSPFFPPSTPIGGPGCMAITEVDFVGFLLEGDEGVVDAHIENQGAGELTVTTKLLIDESLEETGSITLKGFQEGNDIFSYSPEPGIHTGTIEAVASCGEDTESFTIIVSPETEPIVFKEPTLPVEFVPTTVTILPKELDVMVYAGKTIGIEMTTQTPQDFTITVYGMPESFVNGDGTIFVQDNELALLYVSPTEVGDFDVHIQVIAEEEGLVFDENIRVFVVNPLSLEGVGETIPWNVIILLAITVFIVGNVVFFYNRKRRNYFHEYASQA